MKKSIKYLLSLFSINIGILIPTIASSCSTTQKRENLVTTYDNAFDDALALGIKPEIHSAGNWTNKPAKYISELANQIGTNITNVILYPRGSAGTINVKEIQKTNADVILANRLDKKNENDLKNYVNNFAYTGRGFDESWSYTGELVNFVRENSEGQYVDVGFEVNNNTITSIVETSNKPLDNTFFYNDYGYSYKMWNVFQSPFVALEKLSKTLDELTNNKNNFYNKSLKIKALQEQRIKELNNNEQIKSKINGKTIAIILGKKSSTTPSPEENFHLYTPHTYPQIYCKNEGMGLKMNFPVFNDLGFFNSSHFGDPDIIAGDSNSFHTFKDSTNGSKIIDAFKYSFDYVVYMNYDIRENNYTEQEVVNSKISDLLKISKNQNVTYEEKENHIFYTSYSDFYMSTWGPIGQSLGLSKFVEWINQDLITNNNDKIIENQNNILYDLVLKNINQLKYWKELK